jgi:hypothetical protein
MHGSYLSAFSLTSHPCWAESSGPSVRRAANQVVRKFQALATNAPETETLAPNGG